MCLLLGTLVCCDIPGLVSRIYPRRAQRPLSSSSMASKSYLVVGGDVGGTNSRLKLYSIPSSGKIVLTEGQR